MASGRFLATDMDGTFIGDDEAMHALWEAVEGRGITLAFSTGRHMPCTSNPSSEGAARGNRLRWISPAALNSRSAAKRRVRSIA